MQEKNDLSRFEFGVVVHGLKKKEQQFDDRGQTTMAWS